MYNEEKYLHKISSQEVKWGNKENHKGPNNKIPNQKSNVLGQLPSEFSNARVHWVEGEDS